MCRAAAKRVLALEFGRAVGEKFLSKRVSV